MWHIISIFSSSEKNINVPGKCTEFQIKGKFRKKTCYPNTVAYLEKNNTSYPKTKLLFNLLVPSSEDRQIIAIYKHIIFIPGGGGGTPL